MAPGETSGTFERLTLATTTLRSLRGPSAVATTRRSVPMAKSATASAKPASPRRLGRGRRYGIISLQAPGRAAPDRDLRADLGAERLRVVRVGVRKARLQREADAPDAVALR